MTAVSTPYMPPIDQPSQLNEGREWNDEDYAKNIRWIVSQGFNQNVGGDYVNTRLVNNAIGYTFNAQYMRAAKYVYGLQDTSGYNWANKDALDNPTALPMWQGMDMWSLITFFDGKCRERFLPLPKTIQAGAVSGEVLSRKMVKFNVLKRVTDNEKFIKQQEELNGIQLIQDEYLNIHKGQNREKFFKTFVDECEAAYRNIAKNFLYLNDFLDLFLESGRYTFVGSRSTIQVYENKGKIYARNINPIYQIVDMSKSQEHHQDDNYAGAFEPFSLSECLVQDKFTKEEAEDLEQISKDNNFGGYNQNWSNCSWYNINGSVRQIWRADVQWKSITFIDGEPVECIREGRLYGNKYLKRVGIKENSISHKYDKSRKMMDFIVFTPMTFFGYNQGICMIAQNILDMKNALITQMHGRFVRSMGKVPFVDKSLLDGVSTPEMLSKIKQTGIFESNRAATEQDGQKTNNLVETTDWTVADDVAQFQNEIARLERELGKLLNMPQESIQGQTKYVGEATLASNQATTQTGTEWLYGGLQEHFLNVIDRATELQILHAAQHKKDLEVIVGDTAAELISNETVQELLENSFKIKYNVNNDLTELIKANMSEMYLQAASIDPDADLKYIAVVKAETVDEIESTIKAYKYEREEKEAAIRKQQEEAAFKNTQENAQAQRDIAATSAAAGLEKQEMSDDTKLAQDIIAQNEQPIQQ